VIVQSYTRVVRLLRLSLLIANLLGAVLAIVLTAKGLS